MGWNWTNIHITGGHHPVPSCIGNIGTPLLHHPRHQELRRAVPPLRVEWNSPPPMQLLGTRLAGKRAIHLTLVTGHWAKQRSVHSLYWNWLINNMIQMMELKPRDISMELAHFGVTAPWVTVYLDVFLWEEPTCQLWMWQIKWWELANE